MIKTAIERHSYALARGIEELHQHTERMQTAFDEARQSIRNPDYRGGKMSAHEMLNFVVNMDIAENESKEAQGARVKIDRLVSTLNAELQDIQAGADLVLNTTNIDLDIFSLKKVFDEKGGKHFVEEAKKMCSQHLGKPCPKKSARLLWEAYKIPVFGDITYETALKHVLDRYSKKKKRGE
ncbi:MAG: hypothetical protein ACI4GZ_04765 [Ruminococcus sp.]